MDSIPTIIEKKPAAPSTPESVATIIERKSTSNSVSAATPFLNLIPGGEFREYRLVNPLKVASAEADLWLIEKRSCGTKFVLKLYRYGIHPKTEILLTLQKLRREHIVEIVESGEQDGRSFEIQEFIVHGSLSHLLKEKGALPEPQVRALLAEITDALAHLHEARVIHRDIKPSNILVRSIDPVDLVLTDFGISSLADSALHMTNINRTAAYCAPEALTGIVAKASDWWGVGVIVIELLTGRHPLAGLSEQVVNFQLVSKGISIPSNVNASWHPLLQGLLTRDYEKRWGAEQIKAWLAGRRDIPLHYEGGSAPIAPAPTRKPYKFANQDFLEPRELAIAFAQNWSEAAKHCSWGFMHKWIETDVRDESLFFALRDLSLEFQLNADQKLAIALLILNPELPLIFKSQIVDFNWCQQNNAEAMALAKSSVVRWLKKLKKENCLTDWHEQREARKKELNAFGLTLDAATVERLLSLPETNVISTAAEHRLQFSGAKTPALEDLLSKSDLHFTEAIVLLACDRNLFLTTAQKEHWDKLSKLKELGWQLDWPLAEKLIAAGSWETLRPFWEELQHRWRGRQRTCLPLSSPGLKTILETAEPNYLDAVAAVANHLDFINSLGMRFITVSDLGVLFSAWATRVQDYNAFAQMTGRLWKPPAFAHDSSHPVVNVTWEDATAFCQWLTDKERKEGRIGSDDEYRLPFDLEWSHAVGLEGEVGALPIQRAGKVRGIYPWGTQWPPPVGVANVSVTFRCDAFTQTAPVGSFPPNDRGLYDLGTNVSEWCWDWYDPYQQTKTVRGASWFQSTPENYFSSARRFFSPITKSDSVGFRCVLVVRTFVVPETPPVESTDSAPVLSQGISANQLSKNIKSSS